MLIIADENMPFVREWFAGFGEVRTLPGRALSAEQVRDADALLVRSVTRVDEKLLRGSRVRFVGSATSGIEHVDTDYLERQGIGYASAPGCNATAVVEYVLSCLCAFDGLLEKLLSGGVVGVVGLGNVGARLVQRLQALGIRCAGFDPYLDASSDLPLHDLATVCAADVVCVHTPLTRAPSPFPTQHLFDAQRLRQLRSGAVLINASRGAVIDNAALLQVLRERDDMTVALDVWETEPRIDASLLESVALATPHIAGYSWDGKIAGTRAVLDAFCRFFRLSPSSHGSAGERPVLHLPASADIAALLRAAIRAVYNVCEDDRNMRAALSGCAGDRAANVFDQLRKNYPQRREIAACRIDNRQDFSTAEQEWLRRLGFAND